MTSGAPPRIAALSLSAVHGFAKQPVARATLIAGHGMAGDVHAGASVKHRSRVAINPDQPNLRQVHLLSAELLADYAADGFSVAPGQLGENILTVGIDLHALPCHAILQLGPGAQIRITGLRNPCAQIEAAVPGLLRMVARKRVPDGGEARIERRAGIMAVVLAGGEIAVGDWVRITLPLQPWAPLERV